MGLVFIFGFFSQYRKSKKKMFEEKLEAIKKDFNEKNVQFSIKM